MPIKTWALLNFNPRPPWGGRRTNLRELTCDISISIHALRGEGDESGCQDLRRGYYFNPRPPWGGRRMPPSSRTSPRHFNPRPPWGGRRLCQFGLYYNPLYFNPRPPWGGRPCTKMEKSKKPLFQSTPSVGRATEAKQEVYKARAFQSTPSVGRATSIKSFII